MELIELKKEARRLARKATAIEKPQGYEGYSTAVFDAFSWEVFLFAFDKAYNFLRCVNGYYPYVRGGHNLKR